MNIVSKSALRAFEERHPDVNSEPLYAWFAVTKRAQWRKYADLKEVYRNADVVGRFTVVNIGSHRIRLILEIFYERGLVLVRDILTHKEYEANRWRKDAYEPRRGLPKSTAKKTPRTPPKKNR